MLPGFKLTLFVSDLPRKAPHQHFQHAAFCNLHSCWLAFSSPVLLLTHCLAIGASQWVLQRSFMAWPSLTPSACENSILFLASHGSFHRRARLVEAPCRVAARFLPGCPLVGTALKSISPCKAATYHMCGQLPLWAKLPQVQIRWPELWLDAKQRRKYFPWSSPRITTQWHWKSRSKFVNLTRSLPPCVSRIVPVSNAFLKSLPPSKSS